MLDKSTLKLIYAEYWEHKSRVKCTQSNWCDGGNIIGTRSNYTRTKIRI